MMMRRGVELLLLCILACGETLPIAEDEPNPDGGTTAADAPIGSDAASDGGTEPDAAACDPTKPFAPRKLGGDVNSTEDETSLTLDDAEQQLFFTSARGGTHHVYVAKRDANGAFVGATVLGALVGPSTVLDGGGPRELFVAARGDGNLLVFSTDRGGASFDLWFSLRADALAEWQTPARVYTSSPAEDEAPFLEADETLWFASGNGSSSSDIYFAKKGFQTYEPEDAAPPPVQLDGTENSSPVVTRDGLRLYFATTRRRPFGSRQFEIWTATRATRTDSFADAMPLADLEGAFDQRPSWISVDGCRLYFTRRAGALGASPPGDLEAWIAERPK